MCVSVRDDEGDAPRAVLVFVFLSPSRRPLKLSPRKNGANKNPVFAQQVA